MHKAVCKTPRIKANSCARLCANLQTSHNLLLRSHVVFLVDQLETASMMAAGSLNTCTGSKSFLVTHQRLFGVVLWDK